MANITGNINGAVMTVFQGSASVAGQPVNPAAVSIVDVLGNPISSADFGVASGNGAQVVGGVVEGVTRATRSDMMGGQASGNSAPVFLDQFEGTTLSPARWNTINTTMTVTQSNSNGLFLNASSLKNINIGAMVQSLRQISVFGKQPFSKKTRAAMNVSLNSFVEIGLGDATVFNGAHTNWAGWVASSQTNVVPSLIAGGTTLWTGVASPNVIADRPYMFELIKFDNSLLFLIIDQYTNLVVDRQVCQLPYAAADFWLRSAMPISYRVYNAATNPANPAYLKVYDITVTQPDVSALYGMGDCMALSGRTSKLDPFTGARLSNNTPNTESGAGPYTLSTTSPFGAVFIDGRIIFNSAAASANDYVLFTYTVPKNSTLVIKNITIDEVATGTAAPAYTQHVWNVWTNSNGTPVTARSGINIGSAVFTANSVVGDARRFNKSLAAPEIVHGGYSLHICVRVAVGAVVTGSTYTCTVDVDGYFI